MNPQTAFYVLGDGSKPAYIAWNHTVVTDIGAIAHHSGKHGPSSHPIVALETARQVYHATKGSLQPFAITSF